MTAVGILMAVFAAILTGLCGWIFGEMHGRISLLKEQNDLALAAASSPAKESK